MRIEKIELNKVKVTVFCEDLRMFNLSAKKIKPNSPELNIFLCEIMKKVQSETNFNPYDGQVVVEATPDGDTLVLMVSKIEEHVHIKKDIKNVRSVRAVKKEPHKTKFVCGFDSFEDVSAFFKKFVLFNFENAFLYEMNKRFYLVYNAERLDIRFSEFSKTAESAQIKEAYLKEHGRLIAAERGLKNIAAFIKSADY